MLKYGLKRKDIKMNEIDMIKRYLERHGSKVVDMFYFNDGFTTSADGFVFYAGLSMGYEFKDAWFFGHINMKVSFLGTIVLTDKNLLNIQFYSMLKGRDDVGYMNIYKGVNLGMSLMGDGTYEGISRYYSMGFNKIIITKLDFGATVFNVLLSMNGYLFLMK